jgi:pyruvate/2-oxoglutarate/acetoin dehydrogenase E1 component
VVFLEHKALYDVTGEVPEESYTIPFGEANVVREGEDVTVVAIGRMVSVAEDAAEELEGSGISIEIIDPRTVSPLDLDTILESVGKTGRLVVVDEASPRCNIADAGVTSLSKELGRDVPVHEVLPYVEKHLSDILD